MYDSNHLRTVPAVLCAALITCFSLQLDAACRIDWDNDGTISEEDYLKISPMSGYYPEWYVYMYYPSSYSALFPSGDPARLDYDGDGVVDDMDLMGPLDVSAQSEGFYVEWYVYLYYPSYYPVFIPESTCGQDTTATLTWDQNSEPDLMGYYVHWGTSPGNYSFTEDAGLTGTPTAPLYVIEDLTPGTTYYFAVSAYDTSWNESVVSNEVFKSL